MQSVIQSRNPRAAVITGIGVVSPIGIGREAFWTSLANGRSGVSPLNFDSSSLNIHIGGQILDFDPKQYVRPRKSLKVMAPEIQYAFAASDMAMADAKLKIGEFAPERLGVLFGADMIHCEVEELIEAYRVCQEDHQFQYDRWGIEGMRQIFPLWLLKYLPNMAACHVAISQDARGPCNSVIVGDTSSLAAIAEGCQIIERGQADIMIVGGSSRRTHYACLMARSVEGYSTWIGEPSSASRPFELQHSGTVPGEGSAAFIIEAAEHAEARRATILARILSWGSRFEPRKNGQPVTGSGVANSIQAALDAAGLQPDQIGHVNAHGLSTPDMDRAEARGIRTVLGDVPVTAPKSFFGNAGAAGGAVEMVASVLGLNRGEIPATLNYEVPDPLCPVNLVREPQASEIPTAMMLSQATTGQAFAMLLAGE